LVIQQGTETAVGNSARIASTISLTPQTELQNPKQGLNMTEWLRPGPAVEEEEQDSSDVLPGIPSAEEDEALKYSTPLEFSWKPH
jgi:hypothetical protein